VDVTTATDYLVKIKMLVINRIEEVRIGTGVEEYNSYPLVYNNL